MKKILNNNILKIIAIISMLIDHIALLFINITSVWYYICRIIGRICAPIMFLGIAKGYKYTSNKKKYGIRLFLFALISQVPYSLFTGDKFFLINNYNVIFTLFLAFLTILIWDKVSNKLMKYFLIIVCLSLSYFCDYAFIGILISLIFYLFDDKIYSYLIYIIVCFAYILIQAFMTNIFGFVINLGMIFLPPIFIYLYNGKKGKYNLKYLFYAFYPFHLLVLYLIFKLV